MQDVIIFLILPAVVLGVLFSGIFFWKIFEKASIPPWKSLIPIYNYYYLVVIAKLPKWYFILIISPLVFIFLPKELVKDLAADVVLSNIMKDVGFLVNSYLCYKIAQAFGRSYFYTLGLVFLPFIFFPILGFGSAEYDFTGVTTLKKDGKFPHTPASVYTLHGTMNPVTGGFASAAPQVHTEELTTQSSEKL